MIPTLPIVSIVKNRKPNTTNTILGDTPPYKKTILYNGKDATNINSKNNIEENSLHKMIDVDDCCVVSIIFKVCFSLSPLIAPAVKPGVIKTIKPSCPIESRINKFLLSEAVKPSFENCVSI